MSKRKKIYSLILVLLIFVFILGGIILFEKNQELKIIFLDVGQGDATLVSLGNRQVLIDGGSDGKLLLEKLGKFIPFWDRKIEVVIATHPDADHIGGLPDVMEKYKIGMVLDSGMESDTQIFKKYAELISENNIKKEIAEENMNLKIGNEAELKILSPFSDFQGGKIKDTNLNSIISELIFGNNKFLLMADAPMEKESDLINHNINLEAQVLKVGHHGSKYSTSDNFLEKVLPKEAIISVGKNNRYGHPAQETLERIKNKNINIFRTDERGDMTYSCPQKETECMVSF
jgi:competence protein ComEC